MKLRTLVNANASLSKLLKGEGLSIGKAYQFAIKIESIDKFLKSYNDSITALIEKYATVSEDSKVIKKEDLEAYGKDLDELLDSEIELTFPKLTLKDLESFTYEGKSLTIIDLNNLSFLIQENE